MDRDKVIKGLELCIMDMNRSDSMPCRSCPYGSLPKEKNCQKQMFTDALALLKEQEAKEGHWIVLEFCANEGIYCSECHMKIFERVTKPKDKLSRYCPHCGSKNEQFFRDGVKWE